MSHNSKLTKLLKDIRHKVDYAKDSTDLIHAINMAYNFHAPIKYNFSMHYGFAITTLLAALGCFFWLIYSHAQFKDFYYIVMGALSVISIGIFAYVYHFNSNIHDLSSLIFKKDSLFDNEFKVLSDDDPIFNYLSENFKKEFSRGNHSRKFLGGYRNNIVTIYSFKYTNSRQETYTTTDSKGKISFHTRTVYDHYYRYGTVFDFDYARNIEIKSSGGITNPVSYRPSSISLSNDFNLGAEDEITISKFLKPTVVLAIEELSTKVNGLNIEIDSKGLMCISCTNKSLVDISSSRKYGLDEPELFSKEIEGFTRFETLEQITTCVKVLKKHNDNNFKNKS